MASYFDEHDCEPLGEGEQPNHMLHLARWLLDTGLAADWEMEYGSLFDGEKPAPAASKKVVEDLPRCRITQMDEARGAKCPVCLAPYEEGEDTVGLPCQHRFHPGCILPWLNKTNSCPMCRHELATDDKDYEEFKRQKIMAWRRPGDKPLSEAMMARAKQRQHDIDTLHDSMFG